MAVKSLIRRVASIAKRPIAVLFPRHLFRSIRAGSGRLHVLRNPPVHVHAYYRYCQDGLSAALSRTDSKASVWLVFQDQAHLPPQGSVVVVIQLEHTLVAPGGRDLGEAPLGVVPLTSGQGRYFVRLEGGTAPYTRADGIIDYSVPNLVNIAESSLAGLYQGKAEYVAPLLSTPPQDPRPANTPTVVTMHGRPTEGRRGAVFHQLQRAGISPLNIENVWEDYEPAFQDAAILLNVHQTDHHHTLEELRIMPALLQGVLVVTEDVPLLEHVPYHSFLITSSYENLAETVHHVQAHYTEYWNERFGDGQLQNAYQALALKNQQAFERLVTKALESEQ